MSIASPAPGAVIVWRSSKGMDRAQARATALTPFRGLSASPGLMEEGPLTIAWREGADRAVHVSPSTICLLEGVLYDLDKLGELVDVEPSAGAAVLAEAYRRFGAGLLERLRGDFWALWWDRAAGPGLIATDQMGSRPPYFARDHGDLLIASEVPELLAALSRRPEPDPTSVAHWLSLTVRAHGSTLFAGVTRLEAAHCMAIGTGAAQPRRYWTPVYQEPLRASRGELVDALRERLATATRRRSAGVAQAGLLLSGGLDSSVVAALAAREHQAIHAYSATFPEHPSVDESELIDTTVHRLGLGSTRIVVRGGSVVGGALAYMGAWQLPPTSPNLFFWTPLLARAASDGTTVMLDGEGGDELFGLSPYLLADRIRQGRLLSALQLARRMPSAQRPTTRLIRRRLRVFGLKGAMPPAAHLLMRRLRPGDHYAPAWLAPPLARAWLASEESAFEWKRLPGPLWWSCLAHAVTRGIGSALTYEQSRRRAALAGLESRHPLVDVDVIELVLRFAPELAFDPWLSRPLLRESMAGLLPDEVRLRPAKSSFDQLFHGLLAGGDLPVVRTLLDAGTAELRAFVDLRAVHAELLAGEPPTDRLWRQRWAIRVWRLLTAECWLRMQQDPAFPERLIERTHPPDHEIVSSAVVA